MIQRIAGVILAALVSTGAAFAQLEPNYWPDMAAPMAFHKASTGGNCLTCTWIAAQGRIIPDTPDTFQAFFESIGRLPATSLTKQGEDHQHIGSLMRHQLLALGLNSHGPGTKFVGFARTYL